MKIYTIMKPGQDSYLFYQALKGAVVDLGLTQLDDFELVRSIDLAEIYEDPAFRMGQIATSDLVVAYMGEGDHDINYELGVADSLRRPTVLIVDDANVIPYMFVGRRLFVIDGHEMRSTSARRSIVTALRRAIENKDDFVLWGGSGSEDARVAAFVSYSHKDKDCLDRLLVHIKPLERLGLVDMWSDTRIRAGGDWKKEIEAALARTRIAVLLVSADFLASDFIVNNELPPLLTATRNDGAHVLPVILSPCRFTRDENLRVFQAANDPDAPLRALSQVEQEALYHKVATEIEKLVNEGTKA